MKNFLICCLVFFVSIAYSQNSSKRINQKDIFGSRVFIENKGQFDKEIENGKEVKFVYDHGGEKIYFTSKGLVYKSVKMPYVSEKEKEEFEHDPSKELKPEHVYIVNMNWLGSNRQIEIESSGKQNYYFSYGDAIYNSYGYQKIRYKNVYEKIDIEYTIPKDNAYGVKYTVIVHPGANAEKIKIAYSGDVNSIFRSSENEVIVKSPLHDIVEHAPYSFIKNGAEVKSEFQLKNKVLSFAFPSGFDKTKTLIIDPWITSTMSLATTNSAYDVDYDYNGNLFVFGGTHPCKVSKYDLGGNLQWTFQGVVASINWSTTATLWAGQTYVGNFVVNKTNSKTYIGKPSGTSFVRLDQAGNYDNYTFNAANFLECWDMAYQCTNNRVAVFGGYTSTVGYLDQTTPTITVTYTNTNGQDIQNAIFDDNGDLFFHHASNKIKRMTPSLNTMVWDVPTNFFNLSYGTGKTMYISNANSHGFNGLAVNNNYLYFYDGLNLSAYNKTTGAMIATIIIPGHTAKQQGGIDVDNCDNLYIGSNNGTILKYFFNGTAFTAQGSINLNITTTNKFVYDLRLFKTQNQLYVCGTGFAGIVAAGSNCSFNEACLVNTPPSYTTICYGSSAVINIPNVNNLTNPSYSIQPGNLTSSNSSFTVNPLTSTVYSVYITGLNTANAIQTQSSIATVSVIPSPAASPSLTNGTCSNPVTSSLSLNVTFNPIATANYTTSWNPFPASVDIVNTTTASGLVPGVNSVTITSEEGCVSVVNFTVPPIPLTASFVIVNPTNNYTVTCSNPNVLLTASVTNGVPLTYTWFPSCASTSIGASYNFTQSCTGQVVGSSSTGCLHTETFVIYQDNTSPTVAITPTVMNITCNVAASTFTGTSNLGPNVTTNWYQVVGTNTMYVGVAQGTINIFSPGSPGVYWFESVNNLTGCSSTKSVLVTASLGVPQFTVTSPSNFTVGCSTKSITSMQVTNVATNPPNLPVEYFFSPPPATLTPGWQSNPNQNNITSPGIWVIYVRDQTNLCVVTQSISIIQNTVSPNVDFIQPLSILTCKNPSMELSGYSTNPNTTITWTVPAIPSNSVSPVANATVQINPAIANSSINITSVGFYTVGAVDINNQCRATKTVQILQDIRLPIFTISALTNSVINCRNSDVLIVPITTTVIAGALVPTYIWYPPFGPGVGGSSFNSTVPGSHTAIATSITNGCTTTATYNVASDFTPPAFGAANDFILDCATNPTVAIIPTFSGSTTGYTYSWTPPPGVLVPTLTQSLLVSNLPGNYLLVVTNTINGCVNQAEFLVTEGGIKADFVATPDHGFAPLAVTFGNASSTSTGASSIISTWSYGNGAITQTVMNNVTTSATYTASGTYSVMLSVKKGSCIDTAMHLVIVELPSKLDIPNVFTPNGDKSNDIFRLRASNLASIHIMIFDRWGNRVYEVTSETGNFAWDGKNLQGKDCADGTYFYVITAKGKDEVEYEQKGNVSLYR